MIDRLLEYGIISQLDRQFARFIARVCGCEKPGLLLGAALASRGVGEGNICIDLKDFAGRSLSAEGPAQGPPVVFPSLELWEADLRGASAVGLPGSSVPLILDDKNRLYLERYWRYERDLAERVSLLASGQAAGPGESGAGSLDYPRLGGELNRMFPASSPGQPDLQLLAAAVAVLKRFCVISGGPGTGKTWIVARILSLLGGQSGKGKLRLVLTAPTGKAAARLASSMVLGWKEIHGEAVEIDPALGEGITIHRLLNRLQSGQYVAPDVIVVDEASMADLSLMSRLMMSVTPRTRFIWLGDKDQLSSVEAGAVLGDVCGGIEDLGYSSSFCADLKKLTGISLPGKTGGGPSLRDCIVLLEKSYRFSGESGIGRLSRAVAMGEGVQAMELLRGRGGEDIGWRDWKSEKDVFRRLSRRVVEGFRPFAGEQGYVEAISRFERFRVLCALRKGPFGAEALNRWIEAQLQRAGLINPYRRWYAHQPIMVTRNSYSLNLFNGDIGMILPDTDLGGRLMAFFTDRSSGFRKFPPAMLPEHETVFAMTVHKSQGSEYDEVLLVLPDAPSPILTRELVYTGITRAMKRVEVWGTEHAFLYAVTRQVQRSSGLRDALWGQYP